MGLENAHEDMCCHVAALVIEVGLSKGRTAPDDFIDRLRTRLASLDENDCPNQKNGHWLTASERIRAGRVAILYAAFQEMWGDSWDEAVAHGA